MTKKILVLAGDGIGPEIVGEAVRVLEVLRSGYGLDVELDTALLGGCAVDATGEPYPDATRAKAQAADAVLLGAVGGPAGARLHPGRLSDLAPTLLDLMQLPVPQEMTGKTLIDR